MKTSLIITTYNWPEALELSFRSVSRQVVLPDEVIVADDGSTPDTADLVRAWKRRLPTRVEHVWQEDRGFRLARSRNRAIAAASGDYIVLADGDMVLDPNFIADHASAARHGFFVQGVRLLTGPRAAQRVLADETQRFGFFSAGIRRRHHTIRNRFLSWLAYQPSHTNHKAIRGSNQAYWKIDLQRVNGFNEEMIGWGGEDNELAQRLYNCGVRRKNLKFAALAIHLHHASRRPQGDSPNTKLLAATIDNKARRCTVGLDQHLTEPQQLAVGGN